MPLSGSFQIKVNACPFKNRSYSGMLGYSSFCTGRHTRLPFQTIIGRTRPVLGVTSRDGVGRKTLLLKGKSLILPERSCAFVFR
jgi:hypothetical protein